MQDLGSAKSGSKYNAPAEQWLGWARGHILGRAEAGCWKSKSHFLELTELLGRSSPCPSGPRGFFANGHASSQAPGRASEVPSPRSSCVAWRGAPRSAILSKQELGAPLSPSGGAVRKGINSKEGSAAWHSCKVMLSSYSLKAFY